MIGITFKIIKKKQVIHMQIRDIETSFELQILCKKSKYTKNRHRSRGFEPTTRSEYFSSLRGNSFYRLQFETRPTCELSINRRCKKEKKEREKREWKERAKKRRTKNEKGEKGGEGRKGRSNDAEERNYALL